MNTKIFVRGGRVLGLAVLAALPLLACTQSTEDPATESSADELSATACADVGDAATWIHNDLFAAEQLAALFDANVGEPAQKQELRSILTLANQFPQWLQDLGAYAAKHPNVTIDDFLAHAPNPHPRLKALRDAAVAAGTEKVLDAFVAWAAENPIAAQHLGMWVHPDWLGCAAGHIKGASAQIHGTACTTDAACVAPDYPAASDGLGRNRAGATLRCKASACTAIAPPSWRDGLPKGKVDLTYTLSQAKGCQIIIGGSPYENGNTWIKVRVTGQNPGALTATAALLSEEARVLGPITGPVDDKGSFNIWNADDYNTGAAWGSISGLSMTGGFSFTTTNSELGGGDPLSCRAMTGTAQPTP